MKETQREGERKNGRTGIGNIRYLLFPHLWVTLKIQSPRTEHSTGSAYTMCLKLCQGRDREDLGDSVGSPPEGMLEY